MLKNNWLFFIFIIITAITSLFSIGFYQVDEHFQILEFGAYKAGWSPGADLPWEFPLALRSSLQPFIVFLLIRVLDILSIENPFVVSLLLRMITAVLCITCFGLWRKELNRTPDVAAYVKWYDAALLLWFIPYLSARFSSEIWGGCFFFISLALVYRKKDVTSTRLLIAGCLASLAFFLRFQTVFLIAGFLFIRILDFKKNFFHLLWYALGFISVLIACVCLDSLFYRRWCFVPWNYFSENILNEAASKFGRQPVYYYLLRIFLDSVPLQGVIVIGSFLLYMFKKFRDEISMAVLFFIAGHFIIAHKEVRFMFPMVLILPFVFASCIRWINPLSFTGTVFFKTLAALTIVSNLLILMAVALKPSDAQVAWQKAIYGAVGNSKTIVVYENGNPFERVGLEMNFYKNKNMELFSSDGMQPQVPIHLAERVLLATTTTGSSSLKDHPQLECIYQDIPQWMLELNYHDWLARIKVHRVYEMNENAR